MIGQIHVWQMVVDLLLVSSILIITFRWAMGGRSSNLIPKTMELEASLRSLILEADGAGRHLNDQLLKREQSLQKLLDDITAADQKIQRAVASGEERAIYLEKEEEKARILISELQGVLREFKDQLQSDAIKEESIRPTPRQAVPTQRQPDITTERAPQMRERYVEREVVVKEVSPPQQAVYREKMGHQELQQVYAAAESMLKQGQELSQVSAKTRLPVEEIQLLSQMIEVEREELSKREPKATKVVEQPSDSRLGALGAIRRHNATL